MGFRGTQADVTGYRIGKHFTVEGLAGRGATGLLRWRVKCSRCWHVQVMDHAKVRFLLETKSGDALRCLNNACPLSKCEDSGTESYAEFNRRMKREDEAAKAAEVEKQKVAADEAAKKKANAERRAALHAEFREYFFHQDRAGTDESEIVNFARWQELTPYMRQTILAAIRARPDVRVGGLK
jgi:hypothetical protein